MLLPVLLMNEHKTLRKGHGNAVFLMNGRVILANRYIVWGDSML